MSHLADLQQRDREHVATLKRLRQDLDRRDRTIRELHQKLSYLAGIAGLMPLPYAAELVTLAALAFDGHPTSGDLASVHTGKPQSTGTRLPNPAYRSLQAELKILERRASRDGTGSPQGALARAVDHAASDAKADAA